MGNPQAIHAIRNVCFAGHGGSGKTTLIEGILFHCKATTRLGSVDEGTSLSDYLAEEKDRRSSMNTAVLHCENQGTEFHLIDTPGFPDFLGETISGLSAADGVLLTIAANEGLTSTARKIFRRCKEDGKPTGIVLTKMDAENIEYDALLRSVRESFGAACIPVTVPDSPGPGLKEVAVVVLPGDMAAGGGATAEWREKAIEAAVETDDALLEKYLEGEEIPPEDLAKAMRVAVRERKLIPVFSTSIPEGVGIAELVQGIEGFFPTPAESAVPALEGEGEVTPSADAPFTARIFKSVTDDYVGKLSFFRVYSGEMTTESSVLNPRLGKTERIQNLYMIQGKEQTAVTRAAAGGLYAAAKVESLNVSDTLRTTKGKAAFSPIAFPQPMVSLAVEPKSRQDEQRISGSLGKLTEEDPTFLMERDRETKEL
ncbi:MAG: GTP-binding protein, partial [Planctomycetota bacterium]